MVYSECFCFIQLELIHLFWLPLFHQNKVNNSVCYWIVQNQSGFISMLLFHLNATGIYPFSIALPRTPKFDHSTIICDWPFILFIMTINICLNIRQKCPIRPFWIILLSFDIVMAAFWNKKALEKIENNQILTLVDI